MAENPFQWPPIWWGKNEWLVASEFLYCNHVVGLRMGTFTAMVWGNMPKFTDKSGQTATINWDQFRNTISAYAYMRAFIEAATLKREHYVQTVKFDHQQVKKNHQKYINQITPIVVKDLQRNVHEAFARLVRMRKETMSWRDERGGMFEQCTRSAVRFDAAATVGLSLMQITRDVGIAMISIVGMPAGGMVALTAVAVTTAGATLAKYQDTGNKEAALVAGTGTLVMCGAGAVTSVYRAGATTLDAGSKVLIGMGIMLDATFEFGGAAAEGKTSGQACTSAIIKGLLGLGNAKFDESALATGIGDAIDGIKKNIKNLAPGQVQAAGQAGLLEFGKKGIEKTAMDYRPGKGGRKRHAPALSSAAAIHVHTNVLTIR
jgi:hypothetical protein